MSYTRETDRYTNVVEIREYHTARYGAPGEKREKKAKPTPEQMEIVNQRARTRLCRRKLRRWFRKEDPFLTLTYAVPNRPPDMETAKKHFSDFIKKVRKEYQKRGYRLIWIRNIEVGTRNAWHIHVVMNRAPDADLIVAEAWPYGEIDLKPCYKKGEFRELAAYLTKTPKTESRLKEASYSTSRGLWVPEPEKHEVTRWETWRDVRIPKGFYLDKDSFHEGINPVTGLPYREYTLFRIKEKEEKDADRRYLHWDKHKRPAKKKRKGKGHVRHAVLPKGRDAPRKQAGDGGV